MINQALNTNLKSFLRINNFPLAFNYLNRLPGVVTLKDLFNGLNPMPGSLFNEVFKMLPPYMKEIRDFAGNINPRPFFSILLNDKVSNAMIVSTKNFQLVMKKVNRCIESFDVKEKHRLDELPIQHEQIFQKLYKTVKDPKLRALRYRLLHGDIFCKERMFRFKMSESPACERCGEIETIKHQFYECHSALSSWQIYNKIMEELRLNDCKVESYEDALLPNVYGNEVSESLKTLVLKMHLQICRPNTVNRNMILATLKKQASFEKSLLVKGASYRYHQSLWKKVNQYLSEC
jgi:hypothetical protein